MTFTKNHWFWDVAVLWPGIYFAVLFASIGVFLNVVPSMMEQDVLPAVVIGAILFAIFHIFSIAIFVLVYIRTIHLLYVRTKLSENEKLTWLAILVFFNLLAVPFAHYFYLRD